MTSLPYLTPEHPGVGGSIKNRPEDFFVQEMPLYEPSGEGEHVYCEVQKIGLTTFAAIDRLSAALGVSKRDIGYAGMKDAHAVTWQIFSIPRVTEEQVMQAATPSLQVLWAARHGNKLRLGHLSGNRFAIKIRDVTPTDVIKLEPTLAILQRRGMPNYFGEQRFGWRDDNDRLGAALLRDDKDDLLSQLLGRPDDRFDDAEARHARGLYEAGDLTGAHAAWPRNDDTGARVLYRLIKTGDRGAAANAVEERIRRLWVSALQSRLFNAVVARRIGRIDHVEEGDLAWKHDSGAVFDVTDAAAEQPRCDRFEISPSGPLVGYRIDFPRGKPLEVEQAAMAEYQISPDDFRRAGDLRVKGVRRPLRVKPEDCRLEAGVDEHGGYITAAFTLPAGSYATMLMRELMKSDVA